MTDETQTVAVKLPLNTILTVLSVLLGVKLVEILSPLVLPLLLAGLLAVALTPVLNWMVSKKVPRGLGVALMTLFLGLAIAGSLSVILPSIFNEGKSFADNLPQMRETILKNLGENNPIRETLSKGLQKEYLIPSGDQIAKIVGAGNVVLGGFAEIFLIFILSIYLLVDGPRLIEWLSAFFAPSTRAKIDETRFEVSKIVTAYIFGQFVTSALSFAFVLACLLFLGVPGAILLASLAGVLDILPVLGFVLAVVPAMLFAANISLNTSLIVLGLYVFYHTVENYLIVPLVYGNRMRVSSFVVFFTLLAAGLIAGIEGAIVALPIVASYPIIEKIWLKRYVRKEALIEHASK